MKYDENENGNGIYESYADKWWDPQEKFCALRHLNEPRFQFFDRFVPSWKDLRVLDVGCGGGFTCEILADKGAKVFGLDPTKGLIHAAQEHSKTCGHEIEYKQGFGESLPYLDASFDVVTCVDVLEHVTNMSKVVSEISRVLKPNGLFLFDTINRTIKSKIVMIWMLENILGEIPKGVHEWRKFIKPHELNEALTSGGFGNIKIEGLSIRGKDRASGKLKAEISNDMSVMYIGKAVKTWFID